MLCSLCCNQRCAWLPPCPRAQVETEWPRFLSLVPLLDSWMGRGVLQVRTERVAGCLQMWSSRTAAARRNSSKLLRTLPAVSTRHWKWRQGWPLTETLPLSMHQTQVFEATLTYREAYPVGSTDFHKSLQLYRSGG